MRGTLASSSTETTEMSVTSGGVDFEYVLLDGQERNIGRSLSEIENKNKSHSPTVFLSKL